MEDVKERREISYLWCPELPVKHSYLLVVCNYVAVICGNLLFRSWDSCMTQTPKTLDHVSYNSSFCLCVVNVSISNSPPPVLFCISVKLNYSYSDVSVGT